jgi:hypothetical protein
MLSNAIIAEARAPYIARMDGDDMALPERFAQQIAFLDAPSARYKAPVPRQ